MKSTERSPQTGRSGRRIAGRAQEDHILDPYQSRHKPEDPAVCPRCGVLYREGRWQWGQRPEGAHEALCPACRRIADAFPAGILTLHGEFARRHKEEIVRLARNVEEAEKAEHPLNRIASIEETAGGVVINTTDIHLPRRIGEAVTHAFRGALDTHFDENSYFARIDWRPPA